MGGCQIAQCLSEPGFEQFVLAIENFEILAWPPGHDKGLEESRLLERSAPQCAAIV